MSYSADRNQSFSLQNMIKCSEILRFDHEEMYFLEKYYPPNEHNSSVLRETLSVNLRKMPKIKWNNLIMDVEKCF